jgi:hypothetical protein
VTEQEGLEIIFFFKKFHHYLLGYKAKIVTNHKALIYLVNKSNPSDRLARWLLLMEEFDIDIIHRPGRWHGNVDGLTRAYERVGDVLEDDDFPDVAIMTINANEALEEYREIIQYLDGMTFPIGATKMVLTRITHKSRNYSMIDNQLYFQGRDVFYDKPLERVTSHFFCKNFMMGSVEATLWNESQQKIFCK